MRIGSRASGSGPSSVKSLDDFFPHPVARRTRGGRTGGGWLRGELPGSWVKPTIGTALLLLLVLAGTCLYAIQVSYRITRIDMELADPNAPLPPTTVRLLEKMAEERAQDTIADAKFAIALDVEESAVELINSELHGHVDKMVSEIRTNIRDSLNTSKVAPRSGASQASDNKQASQALPGTADKEIPWDLRFGDLTEFKQRSMDMSVKALKPKIEYHGPLDMENEITMKAKEIDGAWIAAGKSNNNKPGIVVSNWEKQPPWPYQKFRNARNKEIGIIGVSAPLLDDYYQGELERGLFWRLKNQGHIMVGISSYEHFPAEIINPVDRRHVRQNPADWEMYLAMDAWLHCMREPDKFLPPGVPRMLSSESDFTNPMRDDGGGVLVPQGYEKEYDFIYVNGGSAWNDYNRNFTLAVQGMKMMAEMGLKVVVLSRDVSHEPDLAPYVKNGLVTVHKHELWRDFLKLLEKCRGLFTPNIADASPRVATEALSLGVPLLMNYNIVGGWKYVNSKTGVHFTRLADLKPAIEKLRSAEFQKGLSPRQWFIDNYGPYKSGVRLQAFFEIVIGKQRLEEATRMRNSHVNKLRMQ